MFVGRLSNEAATVPQSSEKKNLFTLLAATSLLLFAWQAIAATGTPVLGKTPRYINPLNLPANSVDGAPLGVSLGDPTVVRDGDLYYLFATGVTNGPFPQGGAWVSKDLVNWHWKPLDVRSARLPIAPDVVKFNDHFYMSGNGAPLYRSKNILGPYEEVGPWLDNLGRPITETPTTNGLPRDSPVGAGICVGSRAQW